VNVTATQAGRRALRRVKRAKLTLVAGGDHVAITIKRKGDSAGRRSAARPSRLHWTAPCKRQTRQLANSAP
jgi:hypothetical protein